MLSISIILFALTHMRKNLPNTSFNFFFPVFLKMWNHDTTSIFMIKMPQVFYC